MSQGILKKIVNVVLCSIWYFTDSFPCLSYFYLFWLLLVTCKEKYRQGFVGPHQSQKQNQARKSLGHSWRKQQQTRKLLALWFTSRNCHVTLHPNPDIAIWGKSPKPSLCGEHSSPASSCHVCIVYSLNSKRGASISCPSLVKYHVHWLSKILKRLEVRKDSICCLWPL